MSTRVVDQVDTWPEQTFSGGYRELHDLVESEFSGVVRAGGAELYMTRGVAVGVRLGDIEDFQAGSGTAYEAPAESLPLLAVMQEQDVDVRAKYYSEETSISKVDKTLSDGGFTGYIELSENVLSGDYYLVYHAGTSMSVAYVGESGKLLQDDEAFDTADDEVGIFKVRQVDVEPIEIPEPETPTGSSSQEPDPEPEPEAKQSTETAVEGRSHSAEGESAAGSGDRPSQDSAKSRGNESGTEIAGRTGDGDTGSVSPEAAGTDASNSVDEMSEVGTSAGERTNDQRSGSGAVAKQDAGSETTADTDQSAPTEAEDSSTDAVGGSVPSDLQTESQEAAKEKPTRASQTDREGDRKSATRSKEADTDRLEQDRDNQRKTAGRHRTQPDSPRGRQEPAGETDTNRANTTDSDATDRQSARQPDAARSAESTRSAGAQSPSEASSRSRETKTPAPGRSSTAKSGDLETRSIPSIDPANTSLPEERTAKPPTPSNDVSTPPAETSQEAAPQNDRQQSSRSPSEQVEEPQPAATVSPDQSAQEQESPAQTTVDEELIEELEAEISDKEEIIEKLESDLETANSRGDELEAELDTLRAERDDLATEVDRLEEELERLEEELGAKTDADRRITSSEALAGTDIFVRYRSKGKATLKKAHGGSTRKDQVNENIRLEKHTQFDSTAVAVGGQSYAEFLEETLEFQFVQWVVRELLFEIRETGHEKELADLYDVLPLVDRAELAGVIDVTYTEDGQETQSQESFDVVLRDRMGNPLLAANLNDSREATTEAMMERLITSAERVGQSSEKFSGAFLVTKSFFDPAALEVTSQATQGGLLSRDKRKSFVNLSRKRGYHLCLVEARSEEFHLAVPEL